MAKSDESPRHWIWDQSLLTVRLNTITRVLRQASQMSCKSKRHDYPRSIVTDHYLLDLMLIISPKILEEGTLDPANNYLLDHFI